MDTSLQSTNLAADELAAVTPAEDEDEHAEGHEEHIHLPNPSYWPLILGLGVLIVLAGFVVIGSSPLYVIVGLVVVMVGILGWGLEDPMAKRDEAKAPHVSTSYEEAAATGIPTALAESVLRKAEDVLQSTVTISSTAYSVHPVKVYVEREGVVLSLYGKVELEAQKKEIEDALRQQPGVIDVMNFLVAEDALLNAINARIESLKTAGKLEGARNISALVENYIVNLYGDVPSADMKALLEREILGIAGVRVVVNHIGLDRDIPGNLGKTSNTSSVR